MDANVIPQVQNKFYSVLIFGPPGSGKGTIGKILGTAGNHYHLSSGDIFRSLSSESPAGKLFHQYADKGLLVPDEVTIQIWHNYTNGLIATNKYCPDNQFLLLDGLPRTLKQAELLDKYVDVQHILMLTTDNTDALVERMRLRAKIDGRADDLDPNVLRTRMKVYHEETSKVLEHYPSNLITHIEADQQRLEVLRDVLITMATILSEKPIPSEALSHV